MIALIGLAGLSAFVLASLFVGLRIVRLAFRTGGLPEWTIGLSLLLAGAIGTGLALVPLLVPTAGADTLFATDQASSVFNHVGYGLLFFFVWRVFRPTEAWGAVLFGSLTAALLAGTVGIALTLEPGVHLTGPQPLLNGWCWLSLTARIVGYTWAATESFRYCVMLKRRAALGLGDARMAFRFYQWGVCTAAVVGIWACIAISWSLPGALSDWAEMTTAVLGFVVAGSLWRAFFVRAPSAPGAVVA